MKVVVVAESFLPHMNGVTNSVLQVLTHLRRRGDQVTIIAPADSFLQSRPRGRSLLEPAELCQGYPVIRVPSLPLPEYPKVRVAAGFVAGMRHLLARLQPDVVHVAVGSSQVASSVTYLSVGCQWCHLSVSGSR